MSSSSRLIPSRLATWPARVVVYQRPPKCHCSAATFVMDTSLPAGTDRTVRSCRGPLGAGGSAATSGWWLPAGQGVAGSGRASAGPIPRFGVTDRCRMLRNDLARTESPGRPGWKPAASTCGRGCRFWPTQAVPAAPADARMAPAASPGRTRKVEQGWFGPPGGGYGKAHCPVP